MPFYIFFEFPLYKQTLILEAPPTILNSGRVSPRQLGESWYLCLFLPQFLLVRVNNTGE